MNGYDSVDAYIEAAEHWQDELRTLRAILLATDLEETVKWGGPCYTCDGENVVGLGAFKAYFGLWFHQGVLLTDPAGVLINAQQGKTRAQRQWRFTSSDEINKRMVRSYVQEAIRLCRDGRKVTPQRGKPVDLPPELTAARAEKPAAKAAFEAFTIGKRREFAAHVAEAKRAETRQRRVNKIIPMILAGEGLNDRYR